MKLKFIGVGSAFTSPEYYQSNMMITARSGKKMLLDCGSDARFALLECNITNRDVGEKIEAVFISHLHADHIGGMEWLAFNTYFGQTRRKPTLFTEEKLMNDMWNHSLKGGLGRIEGRVMHLADYFECRPIPENGAFLWEGIRFSLVKMPHVITKGSTHNSFGLVVREEDQEAHSLFITMDTQFQPEFISEMSKSMSVIFHDCETSPFKSIIHTHYEDLRTLNTDVKRKIWLYHYQPDPDYDAKADGFKGFIEKGQEFDFRTERKER